MSNKEPFFEVPRTVQDTTEGPVDLPILYYDTTMVVGLFLVDEVVADEEVRDQGLRPALTMGGKSVVFLANYDYRATTVGPYGEVGLAIPVVPVDAPEKPRWHQMYMDVENFKRDLGFHILHLPVTTAAANAAGREIWGLPKFVTPIDVRADGGKVLVQIDDPDGDGLIMKMSGKASVGVPSPTINLLLYSHLGDKFLRTTVNARNGVTLRSPGSVRLEVGDSRHEMAETMRRLGMDGLKPLGVLTTHKFQSRLNAGTQIAHPAGWTPPLETKA